MTAGSLALRGAPALDHPVARALLLGQRVQGFIISIDDREHDMIDTQDSTWTLLFSAPTRPYSSYLRPGMF